MPPDADDAQDGAQDDATRRRADRDAGPSRDHGKRANTAPDAVKDPNEKTEGLPGAPAGSQGDETDPGGS